MTAPQSREVQDVTAAIWIAYCDAPRQRQHALAQLATLRRAYALLQLIEDNHLTVDYLESYDEWAVNFPGEPRVTARTLPTAVRLAMKDIHVPR